MYNDFAAIYYMLLEQWSKGKLVARRPSLPTMLQPPRIVIDPSTSHPTAMVGSLLMEGGAMGPGEELRRSPIEITGEGAEEEVGVRSVCSRVRYCSRGIFVTCTTVFSEPVTCSICECVCSALYASTPAVPALLDHCHPLPLTLSLPT